MPADARSPFDERVVGKLSLRSSLIALAVFLGFIWAIALGSIISKNQLVMTAQEANRALWDVSPDILQYQLVDGGLACKPQKEPDWQIGYSREQLHGTAVRYYRIAPGDWNYKFTESDTESIGVCFYENKREAYFAASAFSPSGSRFYSRTGLLTRRVAETQANPFRKIWQFKNTLIFYEGEDAEITAALTAFLGEPAADGPHRMSDIPPDSPTDRYRWHKLLRECPLPEPDRYRRS